MSTVTRCCCRPRSQPTPPDPPDPVGPVLQLRFSIPLDPQYGDSYTSRIALGGLGPDKDGNPPTIDWGDGSPPEVLTPGAAGDDATLRSHYWPDGPDFDSDADVNEFTVTFTGTVASIGNSIQAWENMAFLVGVLRWDSDLGVTNCANAFRNAVRLSRSPMAIPNQGITTMQSMFEIDQPVPFTRFNDPSLAAWTPDVIASVTNMDRMFSGSTGFDQDLSGWDVSHDPSHVDFATGANPDWTVAEQPQWPAPVFAITSPTDGAVIPVYDSQGRYRMVTSGVGGEPGLYNGVRVTYHWPGGEWVDRGASATPQEDGSWTSSPWLAEASVAGTTVEISARKSVTGEIEGPITVTLAPPA